MPLALHLQDPLHAVVPGAGLWAPWQSHGRQGPTGATPCHPRAVSRLASKADRVRQQMGWKARRLRGGRGGSSNYHHDGCFGKGACCILRHHAVREGLVLPQLSVPLLVKGCS